MHISYILELPPTQDASHHQDYSVFSRESQHKPHLWLFLADQKISYLYTYIYISITDVCVLHSPWSFSMTSRYAPVCFTVPGPCQRVWMHLRGWDLEWEMCCGLKPGGKPWESWRTFLTWHTHAQPKDRRFSMMYRRCTVVYFFFLKDIILVCFWCCFTEVVGKISWFNQKCREGSTLAVA